MKRYNYDKKIKPCYQANKQIDQKNNRKIRNFPADHCMFMREKPGEVV